MFDTSYFQFFSFSINRILSVAATDGSGQHTFQPAEDYWVMTPVSSGEYEGPVFPLPVQSCPKWMEALKKDVNRGMKRLANWIERFSQMHPDAWLVVHLHEAGDANVCREPVMIMRNVADQAGLPFAGFIWCTGETLPPYSLKPDVQWNIPIVLMRHPVIPKRLQLRVTSEYGPVEVANVGACLRPLTPQDSFIFFVAHYDHLGQMGEVIFPGAHDNASGTAMILMLAVLLKQEAARQPFRNNVCFVAFGGEEAGLRGSTHFVKQWGARTWRIRFLNNLDLWGTGEEGVMVVNGKVFPRMFDQLVRLNRQCHCVDTLRARGISRRSDHYPFQVQQVPSFFYYTLGGNPGYHVPSDTVGRLSFYAGPGMLRLLTLWTRWLDTIPQLPIAYEELLVR